jgi:hypothetical protein
MPVFVEDWSARYGSPYLIKDEPTDGRLATPVEDGDELLFHGGSDAIAAPVAFVDGVRRAEATLYLIDDSGDMARGIAGSHGCGAVLCEPGERPQFAHCSVQRLVVWGSGLIASLPSVAGGWVWTPVSTPLDQPDAPLQELQLRMRSAEGRLAEELCMAGYITVVDGPLNFVRSRDVPVVGFVKTQHDPQLPREQHRRVPGLNAGQRTSLFSKRADVYSCYLRLTDRGQHASPWAGIVRLELPASTGLRAACDAADRAAATLPRYAGIPHVDPRAPQNLQPVGALERHLRHLLGDHGLATRAVREAVVLLDRAGTPAGPAP